jgi:aspartate racemase
MKRLGLLGGMSWESSIEYERWINQAVRARLGGTASADLVIRSFNFADIEAMQESDDWDAAARTLAQAAQNLQRSGAEGILLCTNTMHMVFEEVQAAVDVPLLHIADATADAVLSEGISGVALLGTRYTMEKPFYADRLRSFGLQVIVPAEPDRTMIHEVIYEELVRGVVSPVSKRRYLDAIERLVSRGARGVIAGCTEIELLVGPADMDVAYFPTAYLHAQAAARFALEA